MFSFSSCRKKVRVCRYQVFLFSDTTWDGRNFIFITKK